MKKLALVILFLSVKICSAQLSWLQLPDYPGQGLKGMASLSINGKGYMGMGIDSSGAGQTDWYEYDPVSGLWTAKASLPSQARFNVVSFVIGSKGYVVGGENGSTVLSEVWEYDPSNDTWTQKANAPVARENASGFSINNKGYFGLGYAGGSSYVSFYEFDPALNTWSQKADFPGIARNGAPSFSIGSKGYVGMGNANQSVSYPLDFYEYDPATDSWTQKATFEHTMNSATVYSTSTNGYILCGYYYQFGNSITHNPMNMLYKYEQATDSWELLGTFPGYPRGYAPGFLLSNDLYIGCGGQQNQINEGLKDFWKLSNGALLTNINGGATGDVDFSIMTNPVKNTLYLTLPENRIAQSVRIYSANGALVKSTQLSGNQVSVSDLRSGFYFAEVITSDGKVMDGKFIKE